MWLSYCDYFLFPSLHECRFNEKGNKEKEMIWLCARKGKKRNLTCKAKTIWCWAILLYIHMQLMRKMRLAHNSSNSYSLHEIHEEIEDDRKQITHVHILLTQGKEEGGTRDVRQRRTHICIDKAAPQSCPILTPLWTCSMFLDFYPILTLNPMCD